MEEEMEDCDVIRIFLLLLDVLEPDIEANTSVLVEICFLTSYVQR